MPFVDRSPEILSVDEPTSLLEHAGEELVIAIGAFAYRRARAAGVEGNRSKAPVPPCLQGEKQDSSRSPYQDGSKLALAWYSIRAV
jgi:hypothetical protein